MPKAFGYCRLSKEETTVKCHACRCEWTLDIQDTEKTEYDCPYCDTTFKIRRSDPLSIQSQSDTIFNLAENKLPRSVDPDLEIIADINISGEVPIRDRPQGAKLMQKVKSGDYLIVAKLDRAFRDLEDCCCQIKHFQRTGIKLVLGDFPDLDIHTPIGSMVVQIMAIFAEFERKRISERTKDGLRKLKAMGRPVGCGVPRGFALMCENCQYRYSHAESRKGKFCPNCRIPRRGNTTYTPDPNEQQLMWRLLWERSGCMWKDWDMVVHDLNVDGHRTREGRLITEKWCRNYFDTAVELLYDYEYEGNERLLLQHRPPKMENFSIHNILYIPKHIAEKMEAKSRGLADDAA